MRPHAVLSIFWCQIAISCGGPPSPASSSSGLLNVAGEDGSLAVLPGQGFNHLDWTAKGHCVKVDALQTQSAQSTGQFAEFRLLEVTSLAALRDNLNVTAAASFRASMFGRVSARLNFARSINKNTSSRYLLVHTRIGNQLQLASDFSFVQEAQDLLRSGDQKAFLDQCGTEFVYGIRTGGEFFALFEFELDTEAEDRRFSAAIAAAGLQWKASAAINTELQRFQLNARTHLSMYRMGGVGGLPPTDKLEDFARNYAHLVDTTSKQFVTLELITKDYTGVKPLNLAPNPALLIRQERVINRLAQNRDQAEELLNTISYIKLHPGEFGDHSKPQAPAALDQDETSLLAYVNQQNEAAVNCFADIINGCQLPATPFPRPSFPLRRWSIALPPSCQSRDYWSREDQQCCHYEIAAHCVLNGPHKQCLAYQNRREKVCSPASP